MVKFSKEVDKMKWNSTITAIGSEALDPNDNIVILFDNKATDKLRDVAVLQKFDEATPVEKFVLKRRLNYN